MKTCKYIFRVIVYLCCIIYANNCLAQSTVEDYREKLINGGREWRSLGMRPTLGRKCIEGEYIAFDTNRMVHRKCNERGSWDSTIVNWNIEFGDAKQVFVYIDTLKYELFIDEIENQYRMRLVSVRKTKDRREVIYEHSFSTAKKPQK